MSYEIILRQILIMFSMVLIGLWLGKKQKVSEKVSKDLSIILLEVATPALILNSMNREFDADLIIGAVMCFIIGIATFGVALFINEKLAVVLKINLRHRGLWTFAASTTNPGFMGFPLAYAILGPDGLFLAAFINMAFNFIGYTWCVWLVMKDTQSKAAMPSLKKIIFTPINIATFLGLLIFLVRIPLESSLPQAPDVLKHIYEIINSVISNFSNLVSPLAMLLVGLSIGRSSFKRVITDRDAILAVVFSMVVMPLAMLGVLKIFPEYSGSLVVPTCTLIMSMSIANAVQMLADRYGADSEFAGHAIFLSNVFCLISVPLIMMLV